MNMRLLASFTEFAPQFSLYMNTVQRLRRLICRIQCEVDQVLGDGDVDQVLDDGDEGVNDIRKGDPRVPRSLFANSKHR